LPEALWSPGTSGASEKVHGRRITARTIVNAITLRAPAAAVGSSPH